MSFVRYDSTSSTSRWAKRVDQLLDVLAIVGVAMLVIGLIPMFTYLVHQMAIGRIKVQ